MDAGRHRSGDGEVLHHRLGVVEPAQDLRGCDGAVAALGAVDADAKQVVRLDALADLVPQPVSTRV